MPHSRLDSFMKAAEKLQVRNINNGRIDFFISEAVHGTSSFSSGVDAMQIDSGLMLSESSSDLENAHAAIHTKSEDELPEDESELLKLLFDVEKNFDNQIPSVSSSINQKYPAFSVQNPNFPLPGLLMPPVNQQPEGLQTAVDKQQFPCKYCKKKLCSKRGCQKHENECYRNPHREIAKCPICFLDVKPSQLSSHKKSKHITSAPTSTATSPVDRQEQEKSPEIRD